VRAAHFENYGPPDVLRVIEKERPAPGPGQVLVRVYASTVNQTDCHARRASLGWRLMGGIRQPKPNRRTSGCEFAGLVEELGSGVTRFAAGDRVFGWRWGSNAEYLCILETGLIARMPAGATFEEAAAVPDGYFQGERHLRKGKVRQGTRLLIYGASGSCGTAAVQLGKHLGAEVTAVCNTETVELVRSLGADEVIDYLQEDFTKNGKTYDVILDAVGKLSFLGTRKSLRKGGLWVSTDGLLNIVHAFWSPWFGGRRLVSGGLQRPAQADLEALKQLMESGTYRAVIDRVYPLEEVAGAHRYVDSWQKKGNVVLSLGQP
jgi:NADPH:quinone reductase-like Zn-dependent oxidoreductase